MLSAAANRPLPGARLARLLLLPFDRGVSERGLFMTVRVVVCEASPAACSEDDFVRVRTCIDPDNGSVTLATIQRVVGRTLEDPDDPSEDTCRIKTLVMNQRMPTEVALSLATRYAERKKIPVVYAERERLDAEAWEAAP
jgi:hypothetical protein